MNGLQYEHRNGARGGMIAPDETQLSIMLKDRTIATKRRGMGRKK